VLEFDTVFVKARRHALLHPGLRDGRWPAVRAGQCGVPGGPEGGGVTAYVMARVAIHERAAYDRYAAAFMPVLRQYGGRLLVSQERPEAIEGEWDGRKLVLLAFADRDAALTWRTRRSIGGSPRIASPAPT
jgi:uncharacterized protein (DUF1330 family)